MEHIYHSVEELIGHTPLLALHPMGKDLHAQICVKLEGKNPGGSAKDRVALEMLRQAEADGRLTKDSTVIEPTSGNTGIGLAAVAAARGYRAVIIMPDTMSAERRALVKAYGAELILTDGSLGMAGAIARAEALLQELPHAILAGQFTNPANPDAHEKTTGPEIWEDTDGHVDYFVAGVGTGGTVTGVGRYLKSKDPAIRIVAVEPAESAVLSGQPSGSHGIQGIGAGFVPEVLDTAVYDEVIPVKTEAAKATARRLGREEGVLCGISGGAALWAALKIALRPEAKGKRIVVLLPDSGERYLSTDLYQ